MGEVAIIPKNTKVCMGQRIMLLRTFEKYLLPKYLHYATLEPLFQQRMRKNAIGTGVKHLRVGDVEELTFPICSVDEQRQVIYEIESRLSVCDKIEETIESSLQQAEALRLSIIKKAFEGKLVPQDPNDEPAEKLLERIRALRHGSAKLTTRAQGKQGKAKPEKKENGTKISAVDKFK
jgi:type I restriction enzyme S subunit